MPFRFRTWLGLAIAAAVVSPTRAQALSVAYRGTTNLAAANATDQYGAVFTIAGLSGITRRAGDEYLAVMDNSNRLVRLTIQFSDDASITGVTVAGGLTLEQVRDFEGAACVLEPGASERVLLAEEGSPGVHEFALEDGSWVRTLGTPAVFVARRDNFGFESLSRRAVTGELWTANEEALTVDGPSSTAAAGTLVRLLRYENGTPTRQYAYQAQPLHGSAISGSRSGLADMVVLPSGRLIVMERSLAFSLSGLFQTRIYEVDVGGATDVAALPGLVGQVFTPASKRLLYQGSLNNLEGLCLGPRLPSGRYVLVGVVDDGDPVSVNAVASFELAGGVGCAADFNGDGRISVQDTFDFLAAYFGGSPWSDVNGTDGVSVQDIFDFLAAYFVGCT